MMGLVFTEFTEFVTDRFGERVVDDMIDACDLPSGGAYTAVGNYDHAEIMALIGALSSETRKPAAALMSAFGEHLATRFATLFPDFFSAHQDLFDFVAGIDRKIHVEVRKLYPDARPPRIEANRVDARRMRVDYRSCRQMEALADGLLRGAAAYYGEAVEIKSQTLDGGDRVVRFTLTRTG